MQDAGSRLNNAVVASATILHHKENFSAEKATRAREPVMGLLGEVGDTAYLLCTSHDKWGETAQTSHPEGPARLLCRTFAVQRSTGRLTALDQPRRSVSRPAGRRGWTMRSRCAALS